MILIAVIFAMFTYVNLIVIFAGHEGMPYIIDCTLRNVSAATINFVFGLMMIMAGSLQYPDFEPIGVLLLCWSVTAAAALSIKWPKY